MRPGEYDFRIDMKLLHLIADYGTGDPAFNEVIQKITRLNPNVRVIPTSVPVFATISTGFWIYQYALVNPIPNMVIYTNTAPRKDKKDSRQNNEGEKLCFAELQNKVQVIGVNSGFCFSFIKSLIKKFCEVNVANRGSQFRSRDFYPEAVIGILNKNNQYMGKTISTEIIPDVPDNRIAWIDGYGNLKTTTRVSAMHLTPGAQIRIILNGIKRIACFTDGSFSVREGELAFAPGSSGGEDRFMELFLRGSSAWNFFEKPIVESEFTIQAIK